jgi:DNA-binding MarR family transcriptional regulator
MEPADWAAPGEYSVPQPPSQRAKTDAATAAATTAIPALIAEILLRLGQVTERLEPNDLETKRWMASNARNPAVAEMLQDSTPMTFQIIDAIGRLEPVNGITISREARIPKGSVSKITRRLIARKLIRKKLLPNNKKEVLFLLTPLGRELFQVHRAFDQQMQRGFTRFLQRYQPEELQFLIGVLHDLTQASFLDV